MAQGILALLGLGITGYLSWTELMGDAPACVIGGGCATVQNSEYAQIFGVSLSYLGFITYALMLASAIVPGFWGRLLGIVTSVGGVLFSLWLLYAELFLLEAICPWCVASLVVMILALAVAVARIAKAGDLRS
ncbi:MAG: vitamin K epoxide reductase family protein [Thermoleophilia bacterium]|nr:vitamin K epoxide reductase family protein [Thermoleophilia bacterium]